MPEAAIESLWFATVSPPYLDKTNATAVHAALRLPEECGSYDVIGSVRGAMGALRAAVAQTGPALAVAADVRTGLAGGPDEAYFGDGAAALVIGDETDGAIVAELGRVGLTDRRVRRSLAPSQRRAFPGVGGALRGGAVRRHRQGRARPPVQVDRDRDPRTWTISSSPGPTVVPAAPWPSGRGSPPIGVVDDLGTVVGNTGAAHPFLLLSAALEQAEPDQTIVLLVLADGAEALMVRTTPAVGQRPAGGSVARQLEGGAPISYGRYLSWRGMLPVEPPRRPEPARTSSSAAGRSVPWKFGFEGSRSPDGTVHLPPLPADAVHQPMADARGTVTTFTIDRLSYTPSPPMVFAVVDFDGGGRLPLELTDVDAAEVRVGDVVEMTFRRLSTADGIHNYFWKARPYRKGDD